MEAFRLVLMDRYPHPEFREYRVCRVTLSPNGTVESWKPELDVSGETQEETHAALMALTAEAEGEAHRACLAMAGAFYLPVLRETELPNNQQGG